MPSFGRRGFLVGGSDEEEEVGGKSCQDSSTKRDKRWKSWGEHGSLRFRGYRVSGFVGAEEARWDGGLRAASLSGEIGRRDGDWEGGERRSRLTVVCLRWLSGIEGVAFVLFDDCVVTANALWTPGAFGEGL